MSNNPKDHNIIWPSPLKKVESIKAISASPPRKPPYDEKATIVQPIVGHECFTARTSKREYNSKNRIKSSIKK